MLELIFQVEPMSLPVLAIWLIAAGMYPAGLMLGSKCDKCCRQCPEGSTKCGADCCTFEQTCCGEGANQECCDTVCCGNICCPPGAACIDGVCCSNSCPDMCLYRIEIALPDQFGPIPGVPCFGTREGYKAFTQSGNALAEAFIVEDYFSVGATYTRFYHAGGPRPDACQASDLPLLAGTVRVSLSCGGDASDFSRIYAGVQWLVQARDSQGNYRQLGLVANFLLPHSCGTKQNADCVGETSFSNFLETPIELVVSRNSPGIGAWGEILEDNEDSSGFFDCFEAIADNFSATFRITQRPSCRIVECGCVVSVCKLIAAVRAYSEGPLVEWMLCDDVNEDRSFTCTLEGVSYSCLYKYRMASELKNGSPVDVHRFIYERFANPPDASGFPRERKVADLWCDGDGWMMDFHDVCYRVDLATGFVGGFEENRSMGEILCGPACGNDGSGRAPGDPIPLGFASNVIGVPGFPYSEGEGSCDMALGERLSVELRETLTC